MLIMSLKRNYCLVRTVTVELFIINEGCFKFISLISCQAVNALD